MNDISTNAFNEIDPRNEKFVEKNTDIVEEIYALMKQKGINSQKELAQLLEKKESEVSKLLSGVQNMTLRSITNLEIALGVDIITTVSKAKVIQVSEKKQQKALSQEKILVNQIEVRPKKKHKPKTSPVKKTTPTK